MSEMLADSACNVSLGTKENNTEINKVLNGGALVLPEYISHQIRYCWPAMQDS
jgi:hypothetical protein